MDPIWTAAVVPPAAELLAAAGVSRRLAELLALRGVRDAEQARAFLNPSREQLHPAGLLDGLDEAVERLARAARARETVAVVGDYDVDGVAATALLAAVLRRAGARVETLLAHRHEEGYGFQELHARRARELGAAVVVTVDCGTNARAAAAEARRLGLDLIVTDHHLPDGGEPLHAVLVNPHRPGSRYPFDGLAGAGLAFKLAVALLERLGLEVPWAGLLRVACLGTIADVAPLRGENRVLAALGLAALEATSSPGLRALFASAGLRGRPRAADVAYRLAPRLNAAGRLGTPEPALELLLAREPARARELAAQLEGWNRERQRIESRILEQAREALGDPDRPPPIAVAWHPEWNRGVVGIAAARLVREIGRPVVLLAQEGETATGSGRSLESLDLHRFLSAWSPRLERFGGHAMAVGLTARADRLELLRDEWMRAASEWPEEIFVRTQKFDLALRPAEIGEALVDQLDLLEPFGAGNEEPLFRVGPLATVDSVRPFGNGHGAVRVSSPEGGAPFELFGWGWRDRLARLPPLFEVLARVERDAYRGGVRAEVRALRPFDAAATH